MCVVRKSLVWFPCAVVMATV